MKPPFGNFICLKLMNRVVTAGDLHDNIRLVALQYIACGDTYINPPL